MKQLKLYAQGKLGGNFLEVMACEGGCVGGPARLIEVEAGCKSVNELASSAAAATPAHNRLLYAELYKLQQAENWHDVKGKSIVGQLLERNLTISSKEK